MNGRNEAAADHEVAAQIEGGGGPGGRAEPAGLEQIQNQSSQGLASEPGLRSCCGGFAGVWGEGAMPRRGHGFRQRGHWVAFQHLKRNVLEQKLQKSKEYSHNCNLFKYQRKEVVSG